MTLWPWSIILQSAGFMAMALRQIITFLGSIIVGFAVVVATKGLTFPRTRSLVFVDAMFLVGDGY